MQRLSFGNRLTCGRLSSAVAYSEMRSVIRPVWLLPIAIAGAACATETTAVGEQQVETLYMFAGSGGAMAYSIDELGTNLPQQYAPWRFRQEVSTNGPTFKAGADKRALQEVKAKGFSVMIFSATIKVATPQDE